MIAIPLLFGCGPGPVEHWFVVCDTSGAEDDCGPAFLAAAASSWTAVALHAPDSTLDIILVDSSYATTRVVSIGPPPASFPRPAKAHADAWQASVVDEVRAIQILDKPTKAPRSDLFSAIIIADELGEARDAHALPSILRLVLATDGLFVGEGFNTERDGFPTVDRLLERLRVDGVDPWETVIAPFDEVQICGFENVGMDRKEALDRRRFYTDLFAAGGQKTTRIAARCSEAFPPAPPARAPAEP